MNSLIDDLYDFDEKEKAYVISIAPDSYLDLFNHLDHYPIRKRDISQHVIDYIEECSRDIPLSKKIKIELRIKEESRDPDLEERTRKGVRNYFRYVLESHKLNSRRVINTSIVYVFIFLVLTTVTFYVETWNREMSKIFFRTIIEGLSVGTWVFLWEAIAGVAIKNRKNRFLIRTYKRLLESHLYFSYG